MVQQLANMSLSGHAKTGYQLYFVSIGIQWEGILLNTSETHMYHNFLMTNSSKKYVNFHKK